ncbi:MAG: NADH-quinone oxidoreductase subunit A [Chloroflexota bacterium]
MANYGYIGLFLIVAILFTLTTLAIPIALRFLKIVPKRPSPVKNSTFECGMPTIGKTWVQFNFRFYFYALLFLVLDILVVFLYPWAVELRKLGFTGLVVAFVFLAFIVVGYVYAWRKNILVWK